MVSSTRRKMNQGNVLDCLQMTLHHIDDNKPQLMAAAGVLLDVPMFEYRFRIMREELEEVVARVERIKEIAEQRGIQEILDILTEEFEFGHDL